MTTDPRVSRLRQWIEDGEPVSDRDFDAIYPPSLRMLSSVFWTPARVALRAAHLLAPTSGTRVLDVGAGVGKLCIIAAAATQASVTGIEHRAHLVGAARDAARAMNVKARFVHGNLADVEWGSFDAFYFYNPFAENMMRGESRIDYAVELSQRRFITDVALALEGMRRAPEGARVVTYHGLGADLPGGYRLVSTECAGTDSLKLWIKTRQAEPRAEGATVGAL